MESDLRTTVSATLLKSLSVMGNFLEVFREFNKNSFQYKKHPLGVVCHPVDQSKMKKLVNKTYFPLTFLWVAVSLGQMVAYICWLGQCVLRVELFNKMKSPLEGLNFWQGSQKIKIRCILLHRTRNP